VSPCTSLQFITVLSCGGINISLHIEYEHSAHGIGACPPFAKTYRDGRAVAPTRDTMTDNELATGWAGSRPTPGRRFSSACATGARCSAGVLHQRQHNDASSVSTTRMKRRVDKKSPKQNNEHGHRRLAAVRRITRGANVSAVHVGARGTDLRGRRRRERWRPRRRGHPPCRLPPRGSRRRWRPGGGPVAMHGQRGGHVRGARQSAWSDRNTTRSLWPVPRHQGAGAGGEGAVLGGGSFGRVGALGEVQRWHTRWQR